MNIEVPSVSRMSLQPSKQGPIAGCARPLAQFARDYSGREPDCNVTQP
jgi:hypothetical protein